MEQNVFRIHEVEGSTYEIQYTIASQRCVFPVETELENLEFWKISGLFLITWRHQVEYKFKIKRNSHCVAQMTRVHIPEKKLSEKSFPIFSNSMLSIECSHMGTAVHP